MPKAKPTSTQAIRFEFQQTEREAFEMLAASQSFKNVTTGIGNLFSGIVTPLTTCTAFGAVTAAMIVETILFTQDKGLLHGLFGFGEKIGTVTWDIKTNAMENYQNMKKHVTESEPNYQHTEEIDVRKAKQTAAMYDIKYVWSDKAHRWENGIKMWGAWINPSTGEIVSWDRTIDPNRGSDI